MLFTDGEYYAVKFNDGSYYKGRGLMFSNSQTTKDIKEAELWKFEWEIQKDIYLQQFLYCNQDILVKEYVKVNLKTVIEVIKEEPNALNI